MPVESQLRPTNGVKHLHDTPGFIAGGESISTLVENRSKLKYHRHEAGGVEARGAVGRSKLNNHRHKAGGINCVCDLGLSIIKHLAR